MNSLKALSMIKVPSSASKIPEQLCLGLRNIIFA